MSQIAGLSGQYIQVRRSGSDTLTYGGDQRFFKEALPDSPDGQKQRLGCGITALGDTLLYLACQNEAYRTKDNEGYIARILREEEYKDYYNFIYDFAGKFRKNARSGISGIRLWHTFNRMAGQHSFPLRAKWGLSGRKLYGRIKEMLEKDIPVILGVPMLFGRKNKGCGIWFYQKENGQYQKACIVSAHYVVITGVIKETNEIYFKISSWGKKYYISWKEYDELIHTHFLGTILGNILYLK